MLSSDPIVSEAVATLVAGFDPLRVLVFGSHARGTAGPDSDLDLLVLVPNEEVSRETAVSMRRALARLPVPKDVVVASPELVEARQGDLWHVLSRAWREGVEVYSRETDGPH